MGGRARLGISHWLFYSRVFGEKKKRHVFCLLILQFYYFFACASLHCGVQASLVIPSTYSTLGSVLRCSAEHVESSWTRGLNCAGRQILWPLRPPG